MSSSTSKRETARTDNDTGTPEGDNETDELALTSGKQSQRQRSAAATIHSNPVERHASPEPGTVTTGQLRRRERGLAAPRRQLDGRT